MISGASPSLSFTSVYPLSLAESCLLAEQTTLIHVKAQQSMPEFHCPLYGTVGPFEPGQAVLVPLHLVDVLTKEHIATPEVPPWLTEQHIKQLLDAEQASESICPCPHPQYIEISRFFKKGSYNAWSTARNPNKARERVMRLFEDLVALRHRKLVKLNEQLIRQRSLACSVLSDFERRRLSTIGVDFLQRLTAPRSTACTEHLEDILASMNVFDAEEHYALQKKAQELCCGTALEEAAL